MILISCFISLAFWVIGYSRSSERILLWSYCGTKVDVDTNALHDKLCGPAARHGTCTFDFTVMITRHTKDIRGQT